MDDEDFSSSAWADAPTSPLPSSPPHLPASSLPSSPSHAPLHSHHITTELSSSADSFAASSSPPTFSEPLPSSPSPPLSPIQATPSFSFPGSSEPSDPPDDDGFDDFDEPAGAPVVASAFTEGQGNGFEANDDDFGDFGDFDDAPMASSSSMMGGDGLDGGFDDYGMQDDQSAFESSVRPSMERAQSSFKTAPSWAPLSLTPTFPTPSALSATIQQILMPIFPDLDPTAQMGGEDVREVPGPGQVLVDEESRRLYTSLTVPPNLSPLDWTRSRVRRAHLISLGVPVNLDEVAASRASTLPTLQISTSAGSSSQHLSAPSNLHASASSPLGRVSSSQPRPTSTPPLVRPPNPPRRSNTTGSSAFHGVTRRGADSSKVVPNAASESQSPRTPNSTSGPGRNVELRERDRTYGLGPKPAFDQGEAIRLLDDNPSDSLSLLTVPQLRLLSSSLSETSASASTYLSYLLQLRDAQQDESLVSNGMIGDLVLNAQKLALAGKTNGSSSGGWRRSMIGGGSGRASPGPG